MSNNDVDVNDVSDNNKKILNSTIEYELTDDMGGTLYVTDTHDAYGPRIWISTISEDGEEGLPVVFPIDKVRQIADTLNAWIISKSVQQIKQ